MIAVQQDPGSGGSSGLLSGRSTPTSQTVVLVVVALATAVLVLLPLVAILVGSFVDNGAFTLGFYERLLGSSRYIRSIWNTLQFGFGVTCVAVVLGGVLAWFVARTDLPLRGLFRNLTVVTFLTPPYILAIAYVFILGPNNGIFVVWQKMVFGETLIYLNIFTMAGMIGVTALSLFPLTFFIIVGPLANMDASSEEAAQVLGASRFQTLRLITLPMIGPAISSAIVVTFVNAIALFGIPAILGIPSRVFLVTTRIVAMFTPPPELGLASALSMALIVITLSCLGLQRLWLGRRRFVTVTGKGLRPRRQRLGGARWLAAIAIIALFFLAVLLPYAVLFVISITKVWGLENSPYTIEHYRTLLTSDIARQGLVNSLLLGAGAATVVTVLAFFISHISLRTDSSLRRIPEYVSMLPQGIPGTVLGVGMVLAWFSLPLGLSGSLTIILLAYVTRFLPFGVRSVNAAFSQLDSSLDEAARVSGANWFQASRMITVPLITTGLFSSWLLVFLPALRELESSWILFSGGTETSAVVLLEYYSGGRYASAAALAIILLSLTLVIYAVIQRIIGRQVL